MPSNAACSNIIILTSAPEGGAGVDHVPGAGSAGRFLLQLLQKLCRQARAGRLDSERCGGWCGGWARFTAMCPQGSRSLTPPTPPPPPRRKLRQKAAAGCSDCFNQPTMLLCPPARSAWRRQSPRAPAVRRSRSQRAAPGRGAWSRRHWSTARPLGPLQGGGGTQGFRLCGPACQAPHVQGKGPLGNVALRRSA